MFFCFEGRGKVLLVKMIIIGEDLSAVTKTRAVVLWRENFLVKGIFKGIKEKVQRRKFVCLLIGKIKVL